MENLYKKEEDMYKTKIQIVYKYKTMSAGQKGRQGELTFTSPLTAHKHKAHVRADRTDR